MKILTFIHGKEDYENNNEKNNFENEIKENERLIIK